MTFVFVIRHKNSRCFRCLFRLISCAPPSWTGSQLHGRQRTNLSSQSKYAAKAFTQVPLLCINKSAERSTQSPLAACSVSSPNLPIPSPLFVSVLRLTPSLACWAPWCTTHASFHLYLAGLREAYLYSPVLHANPPWFGLWHAWSAQSLVKYHLLTLFAGLRRLWSTSSRPLTTQRRWTSLTSEQGAVQKQWVQYGPVWQRAGWRKAGDAIR